MTGLRRPPMWKRDIAQLLLRWISSENLTAWDKHLDLIIRASGALGESIPDLWKGYDLLITLGRIVRINANGKEGAEVVDWTDVREPARPAGEGLIVIKMPAERLEQMSAAQMDALKKVFTGDHIIFLALDTVLITGNQARDELIRIRDEIVGALNETAV